MSETTIPAKPIIADHTMDVILGSLIPTEGRAAWLTARQQLLPHLAQCSRVQFHADARLWERVGVEIGATGQLRWANIPGHIEAVLKEHVREQLEAGELPVSYGPEVTEPLLLRAEENRARKEAEEEQERKARQAEMEAACKEMASKPPDSFLERNSSRRWYAREPTCTWARHSWSLELQERFADAEKLAEVRNAQEEAEAARALAARRGHIAAWMEERGSEDQRGRWAEGFMPLEEGLALVRDQVFEALAQYPKWSPWDKGDVCHYCAEEGEVRFRTIREGVTLSDREYANLLEIRGQFLPVGSAGATQTRGETRTCEVRVHEGTCGCEAEERRAMATVLCTVTRDEVPYSREYSLGDW